MEFLRIDDIKDITDAFMRCVDYLFCRMVVIDIYEDRRKDAAFFLFISKE